jgi:hypothetical protein
VGPEARFRVYSRIFPYVPRRIWLRSCALREARDRVDSTILFSFSTTRVSVFAMRVFMLDAILFQGQIGPLSISPVHSALQV